ncbi:peptide ligase PGM1-related protein [Streptomyces sp. NPDC101150]|uniref:peptide ligase PGM1-related protein n=1 Tax=Streptomyces sp. NPDC101150 TaxID=3366114 RepID=UPI0037F24FF4
MGMAPRLPARISVESRECDLRLIQHRPGTAYYPERLLGATIINTVGRGGGHLLYVTDRPIADAEQQISYYLALCGADRSAGKRVEPASMHDPSWRWLSHKLLDPTRAQARRVRARLSAFREDMRRAGASVEFSYFEPSRPLEELARSLGLPVGQASAAHISLGNKHSGRRLFREAGIRVPVGHDPFHTEEGLARALADLARAGHTRAVVKLDSSRFAGGYGQALCDLTTLAAAPSADPGGSVPSPAAALSAFSAAHLRGTGGHRAEFAEDIARFGAVAEAWLGDGTAVRSPSFQGRLTRDGRVETVSTHEQVFDPHKRTFTGCAFPADAAYRRTVTEYGLRMGRTLLERGVTQGDYGVDFLAVPGPGTTWQVLGCEVNLRATATKHAFLTATGLLGAQATTDGRLVVDGGERVYEASDALTIDGCEGVRPAQLIDWVTASPLHYDPRRGSGVVLHMMSAAAQYGRFGAVAIGTDHRHARRLLDDLRLLVAEHARADGP